MSEKKTKGKKEKKERAEKKRVILLRGAPGSGKSTYVKKNFPDAFVCSADHYFERSGVYEFDPTKLGFAHGYCKHNFLQALIEGEPVVIVDNTNLRRREFAYYAKTAKEYGYKVYQKILRGEYANTHGVPPHKVEQMRTRLQSAPEISEMP